MEPLASPEASSLPFWENARHFTSLSWPGSVDLVSPVVTFHHLIVASAPPDASVWPSGEKATHCTAPTWPVRLRDLPVLRSHRKRLLSLPQEASDLEPCAKARP